MFLVDICEVGSVVCRFLSGNCHYVGFLPQESVLRLIGLPTAFVGGNGSVLQLGGIVWSGGVTEFLLHRLSRSLLQFILGFFRYRGRLPVLGCGGAYCIHSGVVSLVRRLYPNCGSRRWQLPGLWLSNSRFRSFCRPYLRIVLFDIS